VGWGIHDRSLSFFDIAIIDKITPDVKWKQLDIFGCVVDGARLGIDFGTSTTVAVLAVDGRDPRPLLFDGSPLLPSAVCLDPTQRLVVGRDALHTATASPASFEPHPKRCVDEGTVLLGDAEVPVWQLFAAVLGRVLDEATAITGDLTGGPPGEVVVTCPAAWGNERRAILLAAAPPGTRLVSEPVAAAHHFVGIAGARIPDGGTAVVYDFGAGTFDASVVRRSGDGFEVLATRGLPDSGGLDIDAAIVAHLATAVPDEQAWRRLDHPETPGDRRARQQLWDNVRAGKEMLSRATTTLVHLPLLDVDVPLGREELDRLAAPILDRTVATTREVLELAGVAATDLAAIFLAGGSSRMPAVVTTLHRAFGIAPLTVDQPELAVAEGSLRTLATPPQDAGAEGDWPALARLTPPFVRNLSRRRRIAVLAGAVGVTVALAATALAVASPGGGTTDRSGQPGPGGQQLAAGATASGSPSPSPSRRRGIDPCLLGTWRSERNRIQWKIDNAQVQYDGGAGILLTFRDDGTWFSDYANMQQRTAQYNGATYANYTRGTAAGTYTAEDGEIASIVKDNNATVTGLRNGKVTVTERANFFLEPVQYKCDGDTLLQYSALGNFSTEYVRV
jgi:molecular chaperone DnaK